MTFFLNFIQHGLVDLPWWGYVVYTLIVTHITILSVTIFLHRAQAHRALELHPIVSHFFRFWLWMTTGMVTKEWAAVHRKHHAFSDKIGDPHSPKVEGLKTVMTRGVELYKKETRNEETLTKYGKGTPDDWLERHVYGKHNTVGIIITLLINLTLFGPIGLSIWALQMVWIPFWAAGVINGVGHAVGYRNFPSSDNSRNIFPIGFLIGGEELHNNHHTYGTSAKFSCKWYEFDLGWTWIKIFSFFGLAKVKKTLPTMNKIKIPKLVPDLHTLEAVVSNRYNLMMSYVKTIKQDCKREIAMLQSSLHEKINWNKIKGILAKDDELLTVEEKTLLQKLSEKSHILQLVVGLRSELSSLWQKSNLSTDELVLALQNWCKKAEASGLKKLTHFSLQLKAIH